MVVDIGTVKNHIKPKADSTLLNMRKADLIEYIRTLENNYNVAVSFNENQARYIESLDAVPVVRCRDCKHHEYFDTLLCCGHTRGLGGTVNPDGFCSLGERGSNEDS